MESKIHRQGQTGTQRPRDRNKKTGGPNRDGDRKIKRGREMEREQGDKDTVR